MFYASFIFRSRGDKISVHNNQRGTKFQYIIIVEVKISVQRNQGGDTKFMCIEIRGGGSKFDCTELKGGQNCNAPPLPQLQPPPINNYYPVSFYYIIETVKHGS